MNGYEIIKRDKDSVLVPGAKKIFYWKKGYCETDFYYKCDGYSPKGYYAEGLGDTLVESLTSIFEWFSILDKE